MTNNQRGHWIAGLAWPFLFMCLAAPAAQTAGDPWVQDTKLVAADGAGGDEFGSVVAIDGDTAVVSARSGNVNGNLNQGAVYVYVRDGNTWNQQAKLVASDGSGFDRFGVTLALSGDTVIVGASSVSVNGAFSQGAAWVFIRNGETWTEQAKLTASDGQMNDLFGAALALQGDTALIGAPTTLTSGRPGAAYLFTREDGVWSEQVKLVGSGVGSGDLFGSTGGAVLAGDTALVGAYNAMVNGARRGAVYVFTHDGSAWSEQTVLTASDGAAGDAFGLGLAMSGDTVLVGSSQANVNGNGNQGAAYVFTRSGTVWTQEAKLLAADGAPFNRLGFSVALADDTAIAGAPGPFTGTQPQGAFYVFTRDDGIWTEQTKRTASDGTPGDWFGYSISLSGATVIAGAAAAAVNGNNVQGAAYVFVSTTLPPDHAVFEGRIHGVGRCGIGAVPLAGATVTFVGSEHTYTTQTEPNGSYQVFIPDSESPLNVMASAPDYISGVVEDVAFGGGDLVELDFVLVLDAPCASLEPAAINLALDPDQTETETLIIGNEAGAATLSWQLMTAQPAVAQRLSGPRPAGATTDCVNEPGLIIHDDNTIENGYGGTPGVDDEVIFVDRFTPSSYPALLRAVCFGLVTQGPTLLKFEIVVFDDRGPGGSPGTELAAMQVTAAGIPQFSLGAAPTWFAYDITSLAVVVESGSAYVGMRWAPSSPNVFIASDQSTGNPVGFAGGYWWANANGEWTPVQDTFQHYRSLFIRVVEDFGDCDHPSTISWLDITPPAGSAAAGGTSQAQVDVNTAGLAPGEYRASICVASNDPVSPMLATTVRLTVNEPEPGVLTVSPGVLDFGEVIIGATRTDNFTVSNAAAQGAAALELSAVEITTGAPEFTITGGDCTVNLVLEPGESCTVDITFEPGTEDLVDGVVSVAATDGQSQTVTLSGQGTVPPPDGIFSDRFEPGAP